MKSHWVIHMKIGNDLHFNQRCGYIQLMSEGVIYAMTEKRGDLLAIIPIDNILWIEYIEEDDSDVEPS